MARVVHLSVFFSTFGTFVDPILEAKKFRSLVAIFFIILIFRRILKTAMNRACTSVGNGVRDLYDMQFSYVSDVAEMKVFHGI